MIINIQYGSIILHDAKITIHVLSKGFNIINAA